MDFKAIENKYKPFQMWAWNEKLSTTDTQMHIDTINSAGFGAFCLNAQSGLETRYMGDEWFRNVSSAIIRTKELGLSVWISDENGFPSGSANGAVNSLGLEYQQKFLCCEVGESTNDRTIICKDGYHFYYDVNPCYVDVLNKDTAKVFINEAYMPYSERFAGDIDGFISFEPQIGIGSIPWSFTLPAAYKDAYGEELLDVLPQLFHTVGDYKNTRIKFWSLITKLFSENFLSPIYKWCKEKGITYSAALRCDNGYGFTSNGSTMMQFLNTDIPVVNIESKEKLNTLSSLMASSVAHQFGKKDSVAILFSHGGHNSSFADLRKAAAMQFAHGISKISFSNESSSLRGLRKRTNATHSYLRTDLIKSHKSFNEYVSRISSVLSAGEVEFDTLLISNQTALWIQYDNTKADAISNIIDSMMSSIKALEKKHIPFHIGDELIMKEHAYVDGDTLCIGSQRYKTVVLPESAVFLSSTEKLLSEFERNGGFIVLSDSLPENNVCDNENLIYTTRKAQDFSIHYFHNNSNEEFTAAISVGTKMVDLTTGEIVPFHGVYKFSPSECIIVLNDNTPELPRPFKKPLKTLDISGEWSVEHSFPNTIVLDKCDVYFDGTLTYEGVNAADLTELAYSLKAPVHTECVFKLNMHEQVSDILMVCEALQNFEIKINDVAIQEEICGYFIDKTLQTINISPYLSVGENKISISAQISPTDEFSNSRELASKYKSELSRITYDIEFEPIYVIGDFSVKTDGEFRKLDKNSYRYIGDFAIDFPRLNYNLENLHKQGLPFFSGEITLTKTFNLSDTQYAIRFLPKGITSVQFVINGQKVSPVLWEPYEIDLSDLLIKGDNEIKIIISTPLRNLLGPHHVPVGELYTVTPKDFYMCKAIWNGQKETPWDSNYCLIEFGLESLI